MLISWSNLPARRRAGSRESGRFVAPITTTGLLSVLSHDNSAWSCQYGKKFRHSSVPSIQVRNCATIRLSISRWALSLFGVIASISSMKNRQGAFF